MDTLRGQFGSGEEEWHDPEADTADEGDAVSEAPPSPVGQDERRMQVRAYNHWASLLGDANFPSIEALEPEEQGDFGPYSVLLDFTSGIENPIVTFLGDRLASECGAEHDIKRLDDVPSLSLLSRITDHYMQILANEAPIGFEAEFVNQRGLNVMYRGILLPYSSNDETIDFIYGVINWKEIADQRTADELLLEIDQALEADAASDSDADDDENVLDLGLVGVVADSDFDGSAHDGDTDPEPVETVEPTDTEEAEEKEVVETAFDNSHEELDENGDPVFRQPDFGDPEDLSVEDYEEGEEGEDDHLPSLSGLSIGKTGPKKPSGALEIGFDFEGREDEPSLEEPEPVARSGEHDFSDIGALFSGDDSEDYDLPADDDAGVVTTEFDDDFAGFDNVGDDEAADSEHSEDTSAEFRLANAGLSAPEPEETAASDAFEEVAAAMDLAGAEAGGLHDCLAQARESAAEAVRSEERSRAALYEAIGHAYEVSIEALAAPEEFAVLVEDNGLVMQDRAPMTPVVKLVFGSHYDKTRIAEYATVLSYAHRTNVERGTLADHIAKAEGGLKGIVAAERRLRREERGEKVEPVNAVRAKLAEKLRAIKPTPLSKLDKGEEFAVVVIRRTEAGKVVVLGEVEHDTALVERLGRKLLG